MSPGGAHGGPRRAPAGGGHLPPPLASVVLSPADNLYPAESDDGAIPPVFTPPVPPLTPTRTPPLTALERDLCATVEAQQNDALRLLARLVSIPSGSNDHRGVSEVQDQIAAELTGLGFRSERPRSAGREAGLHRLYRGPRRPQGQPARPRLLLLGHVDTVFENGCGSCRATQHGERLLGPGVGDMKGGVVTMLLALRALAHAGGLNALDIKVLLTGDEELGAPSSRALIERTARDRDLVLVFEPGRIEPYGGVILARAGAAAATLSVHGCAAHSGDAYTDGVSAVDDLARKLVALARLTEHHRGALVNVGEVGVGPPAAHDRVADLAWAEIDLRFHDLETAELLRGALDQIGLPSLVRNPWTRSETSSELRFDLHCPPMPYEHRRGLLYRQIAGLAEQVGVPVAPTGVGGGSDANTVAALGVAVLDGLGPIAGELHTPGEWIEVASVSERARLIALALWRLGSGQLRAL